MGLRRSAVALGCLVAVAAMPADAALPPYNVGPFVFVNLTSDAGGISFFRSFTLDTQTGALDVNLGNTDFAPQTAGVSVTLTAHVEADPRITYTLQATNGSGQALDMRLTIDSVAQPYDQTSSGRQSLSITAVDQGGGGVSVTPNSVAGGAAPAVQRFYCGAQNLLNPPYAQTFGTELTRALFGAAVGAGKSDDAAGPTTVPAPDFTVSTLTPDGKWNKFTTETAFLLSAGDAATFEGVGQIALGSGGGGEAFPTYAGTLTGARSVKASKIGKLKQKDFTLDVEIGETTWSALDPTERSFGGTSDVRKGGKTIKLAFDSAGELGLRTFIESALSSASGGEVTIEFRKPPKAGASIRKDGAKSRLVISAKFRATSGDVTKNGTAKIVVSGATSTD